MTVTPIDLFAAAIHFRRDGDVRVEERMFDPERDGWQLMTFHVESDADVHADHWEIHSEADEVVACLTGGIRLYLRPEPGETEEGMSLEAGTAAIVPRGRWHRIEVDAASDIMAITLPRGSRLEKRV
jgi:quercetin dioxygenase-like cupin family protein